MTLLARPVLSEKQTLAEVRKFCDRRIAAMPNPTTWSAWQREAERIERSVLEDVVFRGVPAAWRDASRRIEWLDTIPRRTRLSNPKAALRSPPRPVDSRIAL